MNNTKCLTTITRVGKPDVFHESQTRQMRFHAQSGSLDRAVKVIVCPCDLVEFAFSRPP